MDPMIVSSGSPQPLHLQITPSECHCRKRSKVHGHERQDCHDSRCNHCCAHIVPLYTPSTRACQHHIQPDRTCKVASDVLATLEGTRQNCRTLGDYPLLQRATLCITPYSRASALWRDTLTCMFMSTGKACCIWQGIHTDHQRQTPPWVFV